MMWTVKAAVAGCVCMLVLALAAPCCCDPLGGGGGGGADATVERPARPKSFASPNDLRLYLDQLGQYFAVVGRPRFGKRMPSRPSVSRAAAVREPAGYQPTDAELYDVLQLYQQQPQ